MRIDSYITQMSWKKIGVLVIGSFFICVAIREAIIIHIWSNATASISNLINQEDENLNQEKRQSIKLQNEINADAQSTFENTDEKLKKDSEKINNLRNSF